MKIECLTTFLGGTDRFEAGDIRTVDDALGAYFVAQGWAKDLGGLVETGTPAAGETDLTIHRSTLTSGDNHG